MTSGFSLIENRETHHMLKFHYTLLSFDILILMYDIVCPYSRNNSKIIY